MKSGISVVTLSMLIASSVASLAQDQYRRTSEAINNKEAPNNDATSNQNPGPSRASQGGSSNPHGSSGGSSNPYGSSGGYGGSNNPTETPATALVAKVFLEGDTSQAVTVAKGELGPPVAPIIQAEAEVPDGLNALRSVELYC
ncbi:hypothetical protein CPC08DRAFT_726043 [Agrocybe pediades]|nr:hypothetical protein CPC08DRAFT_726043 [Agrocybe pediades]